MGQQHVAASQDLCEGCHGVGAHTYKRSMSDGNQTGKTGEQVQTVYCDDGDENVVDDQHVFVADLKHQRPDKQQHQETDKNQPVSMRQKYALFRLVGSKEIACR